MSEKENFIMLDKRCFYFDENNLSPLHIFTFSHLFRNRVPYGKDYNIWVTNTNMFLINSHLKCKVEGKGNKRLDNIRNVLIELLEKKYILCNVHSETKYFDSLEITFPTIDTSHEDFKGFYRLDYSRFDMFDDREKLYIYSYIDSKYHTENKVHYGNRLSLTKWGKLLHVHKNTAANKLSSMNRSDSIPRIYKFSGDYNLDSEQDENTYYTRPDEKLILKWNNLYDETGKTKSIKKHKYSGEDTIISLYFGETTVDEFEEATEIANWGRVNDYYQEGFGEIKHVELEFDDYSIYKTCKEYNIFPKFIVKCENIMKAKKTYQNYDDCFEKWEKLYVYRISDDPVETDDIKEILEEMRLQDEESKRKYSTPILDFDGENPF